MDTGSFSTFIALAGNACVVSAVGFACWLFKRWMNSTDENIKGLTKELKDQRRTTGESVHKVYERIETFEKRQSESQVYTAEQYATRNDLQNLRDIVQNNASQISGLAASCKAIRENRIC